MDRKTRIMIFIIVICIIAQLYCNFISKRADENDYVKNIFSPYVSCKVIKKAIEQAISLSKQFDDNFSYSDINVFTASLLRSLSYTDVKYFKIADETNYTELSKKQIVNYKLAGYIYKPIIILPNRMAIMFYKFEPGCKNVDAANINNSSCVIDVDINMYNSLPNNKKYDIKCSGKTDRYSLIIDGNTNSIVVPKMYDRDLFYQKKEL